MKSTITKHRSERLKFTFRKRLDKEINIVIRRNCHKNLARILKPIDADKIFVISDSVVAPLYGNKILRNLEDCCPACLITHSPAEKNKSLKSAERIIHEFFNQKGSPKSCICALGGGITGNIAGFAASIIYRGIKLIHIPTTLLAQLDSAPDVKHSVNAPGVKNAIGSYKAPDLVIIDPIFLETLSDREIRSGIAEAVKHALAQDLKFLKFMVLSVKNNKLNDLDILEKIIYKTISLKIEHWKKTPSKWNETKKVERLTHLGHTIGKVLEMVEMDYLTHGEAISHGMIVEFYISSKMKYLDPQSVNYTKKVLRKLNLLFPLSKTYTTGSILKRLYPSDSSRDKPVFALLKELGNPNTVSTTIPKKIIAEAVDWYLKLK